jgi:DNA-binding ferritin-like protein
MKKRLTEGMNPVESKRAHRVAAKLLEEEVKLYDGRNYQYPDLAVWLGFLRATGMIHHSHHWQTMGDTSYQDHLLLGQLYEQTNGEIDKVGEKIVGLDSPALTNYFAQMKHMDGLIRAVSDSKRQPLVVSLRAEMVLIASGEMIQDRLQEEGTLTSGLANMFGDMLDQHETHVYLLHQRLSSIK